MGVVTFTEDFTSPVQAGRMFKALILDAQNLLPKLLPQAFKSVELVEGNGGPGSIQNITIAEEGGHIKHLKHRVNTIDKENLTYSYTVIEGDDVLEKGESVSFEIRLEANAEGGCRAKNVSKYHPKAGVEIKEEDVKVSREKALGVFKVVEAYLVANPEAYA